MNEFKQKIIDLSEEHEARVERSQTDLEQALAQELERAFGCTLKPGSIIKVTIKAYSDVEIHHDVGFFHEVLKVGLVLSRSSVTETGRPSSTIGSQGIPIPLSNIEDINNLTLMEYCEFCKEAIANVNDMAIVNVNEGSEFWHISCATNCGLNLN